MRSTVDGAMLTVGLQISIDYAIDSSLRSLKGQTVLIKPVVIIGRHWLIAATDEPHACFDGLRLR
jgi:hypothetical protein